MMQCETTGLHLKDYEKPRVRIPNHFIRAGQSAHAMRTDSSSLGPAARFMLIRHVIQILT